GQSGVGSVAVRVGIDEAAQAAAVEALPLSLRLGEPVGDRIEHERVVAEAAMAAFDLDALRGRPRALETALPGDDAVAAAEDRSRRHRGRRLHVLAARVVVDLALADALVEPPRVARPRHA